MIALLSYQQSRGTKRVLVIRPGINCENVRREQQISANAIFSRFTIEDTLPDVKQLSAEDASCEMCEDALLSLACGKWRTWCHDEHS